MTDQYSRALLDATGPAVGRWLRGLIESVAHSQNLSVDVAEIDHLVDDLGAAVISGLCDLLELDVEAQRRNPLDVFRSAAVAVSEFLIARGAHEIVRDEFMTRAFPDDRCGIVPATWSDIDESLVTPGLEWGAYKAATVIARHGASS